MRCLRCLAAARHPPSAGAFSSRPSAGGKPRRTKSSSRDRDVRLQAAPEASAWLSTLSLASGALTRAQQDLPDPRASRCPTELRDPSQQQQQSLPSTSEIHRLQTSHTGLVKIRVTVHCAPEEDGIILKVVGNRKGLGSWDPTRAAVLTDRGNGKWTMDLNAPPGDLKFKVIAQLPEGKFFAEKGTRKLTVPSQQLALSMPGCYFNVSCVWGIPGKCTIKAARMSPNAAVAGIQEAEEQVTRLRERQAKLQGKVKDLSGKLKTTNMQLIGASSNVKELSNQAVQLRRNASAAAAAAAAAPEATSAMQRLESLFDHPSWSGGSGDAAPAQQQQPPAATAAAPVPAPTPVPAAAASTSRGADSTSSRRTKASPKSAPTSRRGSFKLPISPREPEFPAVVLLAGTVIAAKMVHTVHRRVIELLPDRQRRLADAFSAVAASVFAISVVLSDVAPSVIS